MDSSANPSETLVRQPSHIVGIGASAGGLSALEQFFANMPVDTGMAFVVIQHLSPDFKSLMDDLLSRHTSMPIHRVSNGIELRPDSIYLIPPKTHMTVREEKLYLTEKTLSPHVELPIDIFFNSLADDAGERAVGVVLSGTGSDGSRGIVSINKNGGLVVVQSPESAQFDGMPRSAITTGVADFILGPDRIPRILVEYAISPLSVRTRMQHELEVFENEGEFAGIFALLRRGYNLDFSKYKASTVGRRIRRRMEFRQIPEIADYAAIVSGDQGELELLYKDLLIGVTEFFRDKQAFEFLEKEVIPRLFDNLHKGEDLRVWSAACATGEEAYSIAILLAEKADQIGFMGKITVFATDVHKTSLDFASQGLYDRSRLTNVSPDRMDKFFKKEGSDLFRVTSELRKLVVFAPHNLLNDPPFTRLDLVCCRNLLIYFQTDVQERVISLFHFALKIDGILFLGSSEGLGPFVGEFEVIANQHKMFRKIRDLKLALNLDANRMDRKEPHIPVAVLQQGNSRTVTIDRQVLSDYDTLLRRHMPPGVLINENRQIIHYFGNVAEYLKMPEGRAENSILSLAEDNLHIALSTSLQRADSSRQLVVTRNVRIKRGDGEFLIDLNVSPLPDEKSHVTHYHVYFERVRPMEHLSPAEQCEDAEVTNFDVDNHFRQHVADLEMELQSTRESLQTTVEELQTSNEELQATNEELLASNEELQSTNEELHSVNEELYSVNSEFERKNIELKQLNNDHENLLASTDIGTVFLDRQLRIRKYNPAIASFFKLMPQDIGRPIDHIAYHLSQQEVMLADINRVLSSGVPVEQEEETRDNTWLLKRIMPFRTETGQVEGVVITFTDITTIKEAELKVLRLNEELEQKVLERTSELKQEIQERLKAEELVAEARDHYLNILAEAPALIWRANKEAECDWFNNTWLEFTGRTLEQEYGNGWVEGVHPDDLDRCVSIWLGAFKEHSWFEMEYRLKRYDGEYRWILDIGRPYTNLDGSFAGYIGYCFDITERKKAEESLYDAQKQLKLQLERMPIACIMWGNDFRVQSWNPTAEHIFGFSAAEAMGKSAGELIVPEDAKAHVDNIWQQLLKGDINQSINYNTNKVGHLILCEWTNTPLTDDSGDTFGVISMVQDITERKHAEDERLKLEHQLLHTQKLESLGVLAGGIAHDFNNILMTIIGNADLALMRINKESPATENLHRIEQAAAKAADLAKQMLAYSGKGKFVVENIDLNILLQEMLHMLEVSTSKKAVMRFNPYHPLPSVEADATQIRQITMNLVINASEAIGDKSGVIAITTGCMDCDSKYLKDVWLDENIQEGLYVFLEITDTGCGMNKETLVKIFDPFFTTKFTGRGLGMAAVLGIVRGHKGAIKVYSEPKKGTTFKILLPASGKPAALFNHENPHDDWKGTGKILLVDDEETVRGIGSEMLKEMGFDVITAEDGRQALDEFKNNNDIVLVILDLTMPHMDGEQCFRELKQLNSDVKVIMSSGYNEHEVSQRFVGKGLAGFIQKPYKLSVLKSAVRNI